MEGKKTAPNIMKKLEWKDLAKACQGLGYKDPEHVMRTLFKGAYNLTSRDVDVARCIRAGMSDKEIEEAIDFGGSLKKAGEAVARVRQRLGTGGKGDPPAKRIDVAVAATYYRLPPWDKAQDQKPRTEEAPAQWNQAQLLGSIVMTGLWTSDDDDPETNAIRQAKLTKAIETLESFKKEIDEYDEAALAMIMPDVYRQRTETINHRTWITDDETLLDIREYAEPIYKIQIVSASEWRQLVRILFDAGPPGENQTVRPEEEHWHEQFPSIPLVVSSGIAQNVMRRYPLAGSMGVGMPVVRVGRCLVAVWFASSGQWCVQQVGKVDL